MSNKPLPKVLIIDGVEDSVLSTVDALDGVDVEILIAKGIAEAYDLVLEHEFAVILLDAQSTGSRRKNIVELLHQNSCAYRAPIIYITLLSNPKKHSLAEDRREAIHYLLKPIDSYILQAKVNIFLDMYNKQSVR